MEKENIKQLESEDFHLQNSIEGLDISKSFKLEKENDAFWLRLENADFGEVEGKLFQREGNNGEIVIFCTGIPGSSVSWFENKFTPKLLEDNYSVFILRHGGANIHYKDKDGRQFIQCQERADRFPEDGQLGDQNEITVECWALEPAVAMSAFKNYKKVNFVTHSFGGLALAYSLKAAVSRQPELIKEINFGNWISLSGENGESSEGELDPDRPFHYNDPEVAKLFFEELKDRYELGNNPYQTVENILKDSVRLRNHLYESRDWFPEKIKAIHINSDFDPYISTKSGHQIHELTNGLLIKDYSIGAAFDAEIIKKTLDSNSSLSDKAKERILDAISKEKEITLGMIERSLKQEISLSQREGIVRAIRERIQIDLSDAHEFPQLMTETLSRLLKMKVSGKHKVATLAILSKKEKSTL